MRKRKLAETGVEVSELSLGTWGLSGDAYGPVTDAEIDRTIDRAVTIGITLFDTSDAYGNGAIERKLGSRLPKNRTHVVTKIGTNVGEAYPIKQFDKQYLRMAFERSQDRLKRDLVDVVLLHNPSAATLRKDEAIEAMTDLKNRAQIRAWGVSAGSAAIARLAIERGAEVIELAYNVFFQTDLADLADLVREKDIPILARSVLAHGLLAGHWSADREFYDGDHRAERWNPDELKRRVAQLRAIRTIVAPPIVPSLRAVALRFVLTNELVTSAVLGPKSSRQLDQLVREAGRMPPYLSEVALRRLSDELARVGIEVPERSEGAA